MCLSVSVGPPYKSDSNGPQRLLVQLNFSVLAPPLLVCFEQQDISPQKDRLAFEEADAWTAGGQPLPLA